MNVKYARSSSINTYDDCEMKYFLEYVAGLDSGVNRKAYLGTISHHCLEILARCKQNNHLYDKYSDPNYILEICWDRYYREKPEGFELDEKDKEFCKKSVETVLNSSYNPLTLNIIKTEQQFCIPVEREDFKYSYIDYETGNKQEGYYELRGTIDLLTEDNEETLHIIDYKTGKNTDFATGVRKDAEYLEKKDIQSRMYALAASILYPQYKYAMVTVYYINDGGPIPATFSKEDHEETLDIIKDKFTDISNNYFPSRIKEEKKKDCWKCKHVCGFGNKELENDTCDKVHNYMMHFGLTNTAKKLLEIRNKKMQNITIKTSDRRNIYKEDTVGKEENIKD